MTVKMIALDLDGTLLRNDKSIDPSSAEVLRRAQEQGIIITLASRERQERMPLCL